MWNMADIKPPPNLTYNVRGNQIDAEKLSNICSKAIATLSRLKKLHVEAAVLSRVLYRTKRKMRYDKGIKYMAKVNRCLLQYLYLDLLSAYKSIKPSDEDEMGIICAPSRQMLEWLLVRTQGFAQLFCHIMKSCQKAAYYMMCRIHLGHMWDLAMLYLGTASRIWAISKYLALQSCTWYEALRPYINILKPIGLPWLPSNYELPNDLNAWLEFPMLTKIIRPRKVTTHHRIFDLIENSDEDEVKNESTEVLYSSVKKNFAKEDKESDSEADIDDGISTLCENMTKVEKLFSGYEDIGEPLSEVELSSQLPKDVNESEFNDNQKKTKHAKKKILKATVHPSLTSTFVDSKTEPRNKQRHSYHKEHTFQEINSGVQQGELKTKRTLQKRKSTDKVCGENRQDKKLKKENICKQNAQVPKVSTAKQIKAIKSIMDLKKFLKSENKMRKENNSDCLTNSLDKMQWNMFKNAMKGYVSTLSNGDVPKGCDEYKTILKRARKEILLRIQ
ncbi:hypothetical protein C0J52_13664 [Blattella germanica]|nr:hypothetical protein C0J52_13664 [Blattella germanica]